VLGVRFGFLGVSNRKPEAGTSTSLSFVICLMANGEWRMAGAGAGARGGTGGVWSAQYLESNSAEAPSPYKTSTGYWLAIGGMLRVAGCARSGEWGDIALGCCYCLATSY
jgi:hypothetical protein